MLATDPDADRVGIAVRAADSSYKLLTGNEVGVLLLDYICAGRIEQGDVYKRQQQYHAGGLPELERRDCERRHLQL